MSDFSLSSVGGLASGAGDLIGKADPLGNLIDMGASLLGLPPEAKNVIKIAAGAAIGNPVLIVSGAVGLSGNLATAADVNSPATTEYVPPSLDRPCAGYSPVPLGPPSDDWLPQLEPLAATAAAPAPAPAAPVPEPSVKAAARRDFIAEAENLVESVTGNPVRRPPGAQGGAAEHPATSPERGTPASQPPVSGGPAATQPEDPIDPNLLAYRDAVAVLQANFDTLDAVGWKNGEFNKLELHALSEHPNTSERMRKAARFLLEHPEYFNRLEQAAGIGFMDGIVGRADLNAELARVDAQIAASRPEPEAPVYGGNTVTPDQGHLRNILNDPRLSLEDKLLALLEGGLRSVDGELQGMMGQLVNLQTQKGGTKDTKKAGELDTQMQMLQFRIQRAVERRSQMFQLMSTLSEKFNEMAKVAIQNLGRA